MEDKAIFIKMEDKAHWPKMEDLTDGIPIQPYYFIKMN
jgi:hypothetical protein